MRKKKKKTHGGKREGSGRKPKEPTVVIRVPLSKLEQIRKIIKPPDPMEEIEKLKAVKSIIEKLNN